MPHLIASELGFPVRGTITNVRTFTFKPMYGEVNICKSLREARLADNDKARLVLHCQIDASLGRLLSKN